MSTRASGEGTWLERAVSPPLLFLSGLAVIPAFVLQERIEVKAGQVSAFFLLLVLSGTSRGLRVFWAVLILLSSTLLFNLMTPFGRVLVEWGPLVVTRGALSAGLAKGLTLVGLMLLSRLSVRRSVVLPGLLGQYVSTTLVYLNRLLEGRPRVAGGGLLSRLDGLFETVFRQEAVPERKGWAGPRAAGVVAAVAFVAANWSLLIFHA